MGPLSRRALLSTAVGALSVRALGGCKPRRALALDMPIPPWEMTDQDGRPFGSATLAGRPYVIDFVFTTCTLSCPRLTRTMASLQARLRPLGDRVRLVSMSVDPVTDTPERLRAYGAQNGADFTRWTFVTGTEETVPRVVERGFRQALIWPSAGLREPYNPVALAHADRFCLVDGRGHLRGLYQAHEAAEFATLVEDASMLAGS